MADTAATPEDLLKERFVHEWLRTGDPFKAAMLCFPGDTGRALRAQWEWPQDAVVLNYRAALIEETNGAAGIPSKNELALEIYQHAKNCIFSEDKLAAYKLTADIMGYIEKPSVNIDNRSVTVNKVMVVKDHGTVDDWEKRLHQNQTQLTHQTEH